MRKKIENRIEDILGEPLKEILYGTGKIETVSGKEYFLKQGPHSLAYQCEANGLTELAKAGALRIARVVATDTDFILTEYIAPGSKGVDFFNEFGRSFARLHRYAGNSYGFYEDNFIGANPQPNLAEGEEKSNWTVFFFNKRLLYQYKLAEKNGYVSAKLHTGFKKLEDNLPEILGESSKEPPTLLHGDLWAGNFLCDPYGQVALIDPAVYYGHREADLAMTSVFGGFSPAFYRVYQKEYPLKEGWEKREPVYKLYHILNHLNLFGRSYLSEAEYLVSLATADFKP